MHVRASVAPSDQWQSDAEALRVFGEKTISDGFSGGCVATQMCFDRGLRTCHGGVGLVPTAMGPSIQRLESTIFFGQRLKCRQIATSQQTVGRFPALGRTDLGHMTCEHIVRKTQRGKYRVQ